MNLKNVKKFFYIIIVLTICQDAQSHATTDIENVTYVNYPTYHADMYNPYNSYLNGPILTADLLPKPEPFPYMAVIHQLLDYPYVKKCAGTIITNKLVLTAGNCVAHGPQRFFVVFGITDKSYIGYNQLYGPGVSMISTEAILHPQYRRHFNDIALLRMPTDIPFTRTTIHIMYLPNDTYKGNDLANRNASVVGWKQEVLANIGMKKLKNTTLPIITNDECEQYWKITNKHICTAPALKRSDCVGDNGAPLIIKDTQIGLVSYGDASCPSDRPVVYTNVSQFKDWIFKIIELDNTYFK